MGANKATFPTASLQLATTPGDVLYTCPARTRAEITMMSVLNTTGTSRTVTVHIVRSGGSIADNNQVVSAAAVAAEGTRPQGEILWPVIGQVLNEGDFIQAFASAATALTPMGAVTEYT